MTRRRGLLLLVASLVALAVAAVVLVMVVRPHGPGDKAAKLMAMASEEAGNIKLIRERLGRQLNIADSQIGYGWKAEARNSLTAARKSIESASADDLNNVARLAGWVNISELSRRADDPTAARAACKDAVDALHKVAPPEKRCEFVNSLAREIHALDGNAPAAALLREAGPWAKTIKEEPYRRLALVTIATDLFRYDDFDGGRDLLRVEEDAAWRSDVLLAMANQAASENRAKGRGSPVMTDAGVARESTGGYNGERAPRRFGVALDYASNYSRSSEIPDVTVTTAPAPSSQPSNAPGKPERPAPSK